MINFETYLEEAISTYDEQGKFHKTKFQNNKDRFIGRFLSPLRTWLTMNDIENYEDILEFHDKLWDTSKAYTYLEAFSLNDPSFRALVFSVINVPEMVKELGSERVSTEGIELINRRYDSFNHKFVEESFSQIYELHKVNGEKLELSESLFAIKCWCTSTNQEHWLWAEHGDYTPLEAIASCCKVYKSMLGNIKHIIRQGDVFLFEMTTKITPKENEEVVSLDKETYFSLLKSQS